MSRDVARPGPGAASALLADQGTAAAEDAYFEALRRTDYGRLDAQGLAYLDYTASALYSQRQVDAQAQSLSTQVLGNPHSDSLPSRKSTKIAGAARRAVLRWLGVDEETHVCVFTSNASAALRLVGEAFPFQSGSRLVLSVDNHNSVNGLRVFARARRAEVDILPLDSSLRLDGEQPLPDVRPRCPSLFAFPAQSNFSGARNPLSLVRRARAAGYRVLLDAAAWLPTQRLDLSQVDADFVALSFYKVFGLPTGVGALIVRRDAQGLLARPWFAGGTVEWASVAVDRHRRRMGAEGFEDGTPPFLDLGAVSFGLEWMDGIGEQRLRRRMRSLTTSLHSRLQALHHDGGEPLVQVYGPPAQGDRGATLAFNLVREDGSIVPYSQVEQRACESGLVLRGGCFCNPGAAEQAFGWNASDHLSWLESLAPGVFSPSLLAEREPGRAVGALRASLGVPTVRRDIDRLIACLRGFATGQDP